MTNEVTLKGRVLTEPKYNHTAHGESFFKFFIGVKRLSGVDDIIPVIVRKAILDFSMKKMIVGMRIKVVGEYRSFRDEEYRLKLHVFAIKINDEETSDLDYDINSVKFNGVVVSRKCSRVTPMGKKIIDLIICVESSYSRCSYIPCLIWGRLDSEAQDVVTGNRIKISGRIQSREYQKTYEDGSSEIKTAYEVSIRNYCIES